MAIITEKQTRRNRVQFSMPKKLYETHQRNLELAKDLGAIIDFNRDFERWFGSQVEQVSKDLELLKKDASGGSVAQTNMLSTKIISNHSSASVKKDDMTSSEQTEVTDGDN